MIKKETDSEYNEGRNKEWISPSDIKGLNVPLDFLIKRAQPPKPRDYFDVGTAFHTAVLEPELFDSSVTYFPEKNFPDQSKKNNDGTIPLRSGVNKEALSIFQAENSPKIVLRQSDWEIIINMVKSFDNHWGAKKMLNLDGGLSEHSFYAKYIWNKNGSFERLESADCNEKRDKLTMLVRTKADYCHNDRDFAMDLKSTISVKPNKFGKQAADLEYDIQAAMVLDLISANKDDRYETFIFVAMEKVQPYYLAMYDVLYQDILDAQRVYLRRLDILRKAMNENKFAGYEFLADNEFGLLTLELPTYYKYAQAKSKF